MNSRFFKLIFSRRLNALVAVGENCSSEGKSTGASLSSSIFTDFSDKNINLSARFAGVLALGFVWVASAFADPAINTLPVGGSVAQGSASIVQQANQMVINQATDKALINWQGFDIGAAASINVLQPNSSSVLLNRVVGNNPSQIFGSLTANGHVILVNPNGIVFGADGSVTASAFTASTLGISDADFLAGNYHFVGNGANGTILNQGSINATTGYVALLGANVTNDGKITTNQSNVYMGAAQSITVPVSNSGRIRMELDPSSVNAAVNNNQNGVIVTSGGQVLMQASAVNDAMATASITHSGQINTTAAQAGSVSLLADGGNIRVSGSVVASSTNSANQGGDIIIGRDLVTGALAKSTDVSGATLLSNKGFLETSAHLLATDGIEVNVGTWLLDPDNIDITGDATAATSGYSKIKASDIATALNAGTSVVISTTTASSINQPNYSNMAGNGSGAAVSGDGNILISSAIVKSGNSNANLSLLADNSITVNARVGKSASDTTSTGKLDVTMTASGNSSIVTNSKGLVLSSFIDANGGVVNLSGTNKNTNNSNSNSGVVFNSGSGISAATYSVVGTQSAAVSSSNFNGVFFNGNVSLTSTTGASSIRGSSNAWGNFGQGILFQDNTTTNFDSGLGTLSVVGVNTGGANGTRVGYNGGAANINTRGTVTLGSNESGGAWGQRSGTITAVTGTLNITGNNVTTYNGQAFIKASDGTTLNISAPSINFGSVPVGSEGAPTIGLASGATGYTLNISANNLIINTAIPTAQNAGTGSITIKNYSVGTKINVGGADVSASPVTLGLSSAELNTFSAANTIIGSNTAGDLTVSSAITTNLAMGNISLITGGNMAINGMLTVGGLAGSKTLTLSAQGSTSGVTQSSALKASGLELLGTNASYVLDDNNNSIATLAANAKSVTYKNSSVLTIGTVNTSGITTNAGATILTQVGDLNVNALITNSGVGVTGNVVVGAGINSLAGTGSGGDVRTVNGVSITQSNLSGKTYIYTGQASDTGVLSYLDSSFSSLYYQGTSQTLNAAFNQAYNSTISGGANAQVIFREATLPNFSLALPAVTLVKTYGAADPAISDIRAALQTAYNGSSTLTNSVVGVGGNNTFAFSAVDAINSLSGGRAAGNDASITPYAYTLTSSLNTTVTGTQPSLRIDKAGLVAVIDNITTTYGTVLPLTAQFSGFATGENAANVGISLVGLTSTGYTGSTTTNNVINGGYAITVDPSVNQNSTTNYYISSITNGTLTINPATISLFANNASKLVTRSDPALTYSYSGLVNGDSSSVLSSPTLTRQVGESAGPYVITAAGASAGNNYTIQYTPGVFTIAGVQKVLIQMCNVSTVYGSTVTPSIQSVEYIDNSSVIFTLSRVANTDTWTDGVGGSITVVPTLNGISATSNVGVYQNAVTNTNNGTVSSSGNFNGVITQNANVIISPKAAAINIANVSRTYDGSAFTSAQASASTSDLVNGDTITSLGGLSYNGSAIGSAAAGTYTIGANLTNPSAASNYLMTINSGTLTTRAVVNPTPAKEDKPFVNPVTPKPVTPTGSGSKSKVSSSTTAQSVDVKLAAIEKPSLAEQCSATTGKSEKCDCQKTLFEDVMLCKVPLEGSGQPAHATKKAKAHSNLN